jgi:hypothetical protein
MAENNQKPINPVIRTVPPVSPGVPVQTGMTRITRFFPASTWHDAGISDKEVITVQENPLLSGLRGWS